MDREETLGRTTAGWSEEGQTLTYPGSELGAFRSREDAAILGRHGYVVAQRLMDADDAVLTVTYEREGRGAHPAILDPVAQGRAIAAYERDHLAAARGHRYRSAGGAVLLRGATFLGYGLVALAVIGVLAGAVWLGGLKWGGTESTGTSACERAFIDASDGTVTTGHDYDLDPAIRACGSLAEWSAAWAHYYPSSLAGSDPQFVAESRCLSGHFDDTPICRELVP